jgi:hypothetical protein
MNERIRQLARQAQVGSAEFGNGISYFVSTEETFNKFAELIVRECAIAFEAEVDSWKEMEPYQGSIKRQGTKAIKQHFGVEE